MEKRKKTIFILIWLCASTLFLGGMSYFSPVMNISSIRSTKEPGKEYKIEQKLSEIPFDFSELRTGDLILRTGNNFFSDELRRFNRQDDTYSHCGLVVRNGDKIYVYHAIGGTNNPDNRMRKDEIRNFINPVYNFGFGIYRYNLTEQQQEELKIEVLSLYEQEIEFDLKFDLNNNDKLYCSEFIYKVLIKITDDQNYIPLSEFNNKKYVGIDNLYLNNNSKKLIRYEY